MGSFCRESGIAAFATGVRRVACRQTPLRLTQFPEFTRESAKSRRVGEGMEAVAERKSLSAMLKNTARGTHAPQFGWKVIDDGGPFGPTQGRRRPPLQ